MTLEQALAHFNGNQAALAAAAGRNRSAVNHWKDRDGIIPIIAQLKIQKATKGKLKADPV